MHDTDTIDALAYILVFSNSLLNLYCVNRGGKPHVRPQSIIRSQDLIRSSYNSVQPLRKSHSFSSSQIPLHTKKSFQNLIKSTRNQIV